MMRELSVSRGIWWCLAVIMLSSTVFFEVGDAEFHGWSYIVYPKKVLVKRTCEGGWIGRKTLFWLRNPFTRHHY
jgi:hypothetical protein